MAIVRALVAYEFPDLDTVLNMLFTYDNMNQNKEITVDMFKQWILRDVKVDVAERDLKLFVKANAALSRKSGLIDKQDLMDILGDDFKQARFQFLD